MNLRSRSRNCCGVCTSLSRSIRLLSPEKYWSMSSCEWPDSRKRTSSRATRLLPTNTPARRQIVLFLFSRPQLSHWRSISHWRKSVVRDTFSSACVMSSAVQLESFFVYGSEQARMRLWPCVITAVRSKLGRTKLPKAFVPHTALLGYRYLDLSIPSQINATVVSPFGWTPILLFARPCQYITLSWYWRSKWSWYSFIWKARNLLSDPNLFNIILCLEQVVQEEWCETRRMAIFVKSRPHTSFSELNWVPQLSFQNDSKW